MDLEIRFCTSSDGTRIAYTVVGNGEGTPLFLLPGMGWTLEIGIREDGQDSGSALSLDDRMVVALDRRGIGSSQRNIKNAGLDAFVADIAAVADHVGLQRFDILGQRDGAAAGLAFAARNPERVSRLVLWGFYAKGKEVFSQLLSRVGVILIRRNWNMARRILPVFIVSSEKQSWYTEYLDKAMSPDVAAKYVEYITRLDITRDLPNVQAPTLVLHASEDRTVPIDRGRAAAARIPGARFVALEESAEEPGSLTEHVEKLVLEFLDEERPDRSRPAEEEASRSPVRDKYRSAVGDVRRTEDDAAETRKAARSFASGRYKAERLLGEGAQKSVYLVEDTVLGRQCALSVLNPALLEPDDVARIKHEAQAMARIGAHANIVTIFDYGEDDGAPFIVSEFVPGGELRDELAAAGGPLPLERALTIATDICRALSVAHGCDIIHRDLKPENVWLTNERSAKLGDFGIALAVGRTRLTAPGGLIGSAAYISPEQASGGDVDGRSDLYAFGALLYELVTGRPPFVGDDPNAVIYQHVNTEPASPAEHNDSLPPSLERLIMKLLAKPKAERPGSAAEVLAELERSSAELAGGAADMYTILFTDMEGSTTLADRLGDGPAQEVRRAHNDIVRTALAANGGNEIKHTGDGIMASFSTTSAALDSAIAIQRGVAEHKQEHPDSPLGVYIGLNAGEPIAEEGDLFGTSINLAARICDHAEAGQILAANVVRELAAGKQFLFADLGETELRGFEDPIKLWELRWQE